MIRWYVLSRISYSYYNKKVYYYYNKKLIILRNEGDNMTDKQVRKIIEEALTKILGEYGSDPNASIEMLPLLEDYQVLQFYADVVVHIDVARVKLTTLDRDHGYTIGSED